MKTLRKSLGSGSKISSLAGLVLAALSPNTPQLEMPADGADITDGVRLNLQDNVAMADEGGDSKQKQIKSAFHHDDNFNINGYFPGGDKTHEISLSLEGVAGLSRVKGFAGWNADLSYVWCPIQLDDVMNLFCVGAGIGVSDLSTNGTLEGDQLDQASSGRLIRGGDLHLIFHPIEMVSGQNIRITYNVEIGRGYYLVRLPDWMIDSVDGEIQPYGVYEGWNVETTISTQLRVLGPLWSFINLTGESNNVYVEGAPDREEAWFYGGSNGGEVTVPPIMKNAALTVSIGLQGNWILPNFHLKGERFKAIR